MKTLLILAAMSLTGCMQTVESTIGPSSNQAKTQAALSPTDSANIAIKAYLNGRQIIDSTSECEEWGTYATMAVARHRMSVEEAILVIPSKCFTK